MFTLLSMWSENIYILYTKVSIENIKLIEASKIRQIISLTKS